MSLSGINKEEAGIFYKFFSKKEGETLLSRFKKKLEKHIY